MVYCEGQKQEKFLSEAGCERFMYHSCTTQYNQVCFHLESNSFKYLIFKKQFIWKSIYYVVMLV